MATHDYPSELYPQDVGWGIQKAAVSFRSPLAGSVESIEFPGQFWRVSISVPESKLRKGSAGEAFFNRIAGGMERLRVPYWPRLVPEGTMRGSPTLAIAAARGDLALSISTTGNLRRGDMIGAGTQTFQVFTDCDPVAGVLTVPLVNRVRGPIVLGAAVTWNAPTTTCVIPSLSSMATYSPGKRQTVAVDLEEV